jgi:hypothetical protein
MKKVFLHVRSPGKMDWENSGREFLRLPVVGEYLATSSDSAWYQVELVVHCPFSAEYTAEVYAVKVDRAQVKHEAFKG